MYSGIKNVKVGLAFFACLVILFHAFVSSVDFF